MCLIGSTSNRAIVTGLKPYTLYELKVRTHDHSNRHSEYSQTLECRTLEGGELTFKRIDCGDPHFCQTYLNFKYRDSCFLRLGRIS